MKKERIIQSQKLVTQGETIAMVPMGKVAHLSLCGEDNIIELVDIIARFLTCEHPAVRVLFKDLQFDNMGLVCPDSANLCRTSAKHRMDDLLDQLLGVARFETKWTGPQVLEIRQKDKTVGMSPFEEIVLTAIRAVETEGDLVIIEYLLKCVTIRSNYDLVLKELREKIFKVHEGGMAEAMFSLMKAHVDRRRPQT